MGSLCTLRETEAGALRELTAARGDGRGNGDQCHPGSPGWSARREAHRDCGPEVEACAALSLRDLGLRETGLPRSVSSLTTSWLTRTRFWLARLWWDPGSTQQASRLSQRDDRFGDDPVVEALRETLYYKVLQLLRVTQILAQRL